MDKILLMKGSQPTNLGNGFINYGSENLIRRAAPNAKIFSFSGMFNFIFGNDDDVFNPFYCIDSKYFIISGPLCNERFATSFDKLISSKIKKGTRIILNGVGGYTYSEKEVDAFQKFLKRNNVYAFISRDKKAYSNYKGLAEHSHCGLDCAFFVSDFFNPPKMEIEDFVIFNFDSTEEPKIDVGGHKIIRTCHSIMPLYKIKKRKNIFLSNLPTDYFPLYANTNATYTDRVHACVVTFSFGNKIRFYYNTERAELLKMVCSDDFKNKLVSADKLKLKKEKKKHFEFLKEIL